tara:strand:- start:1043 stop:1165 length:123 start_codon:yes stop_codon:yes gene_type:complete
MSNENAWTPAQGVSAGNVKVGGDAVKVEEPKDGDKSESNK